MGPENCRVAKTCSESSDRAASGTRRAVHLHSSACFPSKSTHMCVYPPHASYCRFAGFSRPVVRSSQEEPDSGPPRPTAAPQHGLSRLKQDLLELEDYIPWNAVVTRWGGKRGMWARKIRECKDANAVARQLITLEQAIVWHAFEDSWRQSAREKWSKELQKETNPAQVGQPCLWLLGDAYRAVKYAGSGAGARNGGALALADFRDARLDIYQTEGCA